MNSGHHSGSEEFPDLDITRASQQQRALSQIRDMIVKGELPPGSRLQEQVLSDYLGLSRTPVREAFRALAVEGLVVLKPNRGAQVRSMSLNELMDTFQVIAALDAMAGELAAQRALDSEIEQVARLHEQMLVCYANNQLLEYFKYNQAIHRQIIASARNPVLERQLQALNTQVQPYRLNVNSEPESWRRSIADHETMLSALRARDGKTLQGVLRQHLPDKFGVLARLEHLKTSGSRGRRVRLRTVAPTSD